MQINSYGQTLVPVLDVSKYQDKNTTPQRPNFVKAKREGIEAVVLRATENANEDEDFEYNFKAVQDAGMLPMVYSFFEYRTGIMKSPEYQANKCLEVVTRANGAVKGVPIFLDYERPNAIWPALPSYSTSIRYLSLWYNIVDLETERLAGLYGNRATIYNISPVPIRTQSRPLWIAGWPFSRMVTPEEFEKISWRPVVSPWTRSTLWQVGVTDGIRFGMESLEVDLNFFMGTIEDLYAFCGKTIPCIPPTEDFQTQLDNVAKEIEELKEEMRKHGWLI